MSSPEVDYALPADVPRTRRRDRAERPTGPLWSGRQRTWLQAGCWGLAALLSLPLLVPLLRDDQTGADTPEAAVARLLQGVADTDPVAIVAALDPIEADDPDRASEAYDLLGSRLLRTGEVPPADVTAVLAAAERQLDGSVDLTAVATVAALDLELVGLDLRTEPDPATLSRAQVFIDGGDLEVVLDPARLPESVSDLQRALYTMPLAEGWRRDRRVDVQPFLVAVERDGRWYVSLEASADALLPERGGRR